MKLRDAKSVKDVIKWMQEKGLSPGENAFVGTVHDVHTPTSLHYRIRRDGILVVAPNKQGHLAIDLNDNDVEDDKFGKKMTDETAALTFVYFRLLAVAEQEDWPVNEMFFWKWGYKRTAGFDTNVPISGHNDHLHIGFDNGTWK